MTVNVRHDIGIASQIGKYGDAVEAPAAARWLFSAGTPGLSADGVVPEGITAQAELAWSHIATLLGRAGMRMEDLVKVTQYLTREADIPDYAQVRARYLGDARPASMLLVVPALVRPGFVLEVEIIAAKS